LLGLTPQGASGELFGRLHRLPKFSYQTIRNFALSTPFHRAEEQAAVTGLIRPENRLSFLVDHRNRASGNIMELEIAADDLGAGAFFFPH
jgi:hypothetical protein